MAQTILHVLILLAGFVPLIAGATYLVNGASSIAKRLGIPAIVIGLTIVAFGTSAPELLVNTLASARGNADIPLGNILGSNIFNILLILGLTSIITPLAVKTNTTWSEIPLAILSAVTLFVLSKDRWLDSGAVDIISRSEGILLLLFFLIFLAYNIHLTKSSGAPEEWDSPDYATGWAILAIIGGITGLALGGHLIVTYAVKVAQALHISERVISLTIISIGTSLPELATSLVAARKKNVDIAIGNVVGSNIFNVFLILGVSAVISPLAISASTQVDILVNIGASVLLFLFIFTGKGRQLERWEGILFLLAYAGYMVYLFI